MITEEDIQKQIEEDQKIIDKIHDDLKAAKRYNRIATSQPKDLSRATKGGKNE